MMSQVLQCTQLAKLMWICASTISYTAAGQKCWHGIAELLYTTMVADIRIADDQVYRLIVVVARA